MILILGVISVMNMTTDLMPSINLPYAVVYTTYPGASPEEVETAVTRPVESAMATVSDIENIQSVSSENLSLVILEFAESANMDSVTVEMRENLDTIRSYWDDSVGSPVIMRINPDMLPVMIAAVDYEGYESIALGDYVDANLLSEIESIEGVASVSASGGIEESVQVTISPEKLAVMNEKVRAALDEKFADAREELLEARQKIEDGIQEVDDGADELASARKQIESGQKELADQLSKAKAAADAQAAQLLETKMGLNQKLFELNQQRQDLTQRRTQLAAVKDNLESLMSQGDRLDGSIAELESMNETYLRLTEQIAAFDEQIAAINESELSQEDKDAQIAAITGSAEYTTALEQVTQIQQQCALMGLTPEGIPTRIEELKTAKAAINDGLASIEEFLASQGYGIDELGTLISQIDEGFAAIDQGEATINDTLKQLDSGMISIQQAQQQIAVQEASANYKIYASLAEVTSGAATLAATKTQLEAALEQIDSSEEQLQDAVDAAYKQSDLSTILSRSVLGQILTAQNFAMPAGYLTGEDDTDTMLRVGDKIGDLEELKTLIILDLGLEGLDPVRLQDIADITVIDNSAEVYATINGKPGILLTMDKQTGYSTGEVADNLKERFEKLSAANEGLHFTVLMDQGIYIDYVVNSVFQNLLMGALLAVLVLILFLRDFRPTLVIALSIPISLLTALIAMYFSKISLNVISLSGLALGVGMLVDNSIVVVENIYRMRGEGVSVKTAAVEGAKQVGGAIAASTLTTCCVFLPIVFTKGITKQLFVDLGLTITYSLMASLLIAMTLVPMLSSGLLKNVPEKKSRIIEKLTQIYSRSITWVLGRKAVVLILTVVLLIGSGVMAYRNGTSFMPSMESTQATLNLRAPEGSTLEETAALSQEVIERIMTIDDIDGIGAMSGGGGAMSLFRTGGRTSTDRITMYLLFSEDKTLSNAELKARILELTEDLDCTISVSVEVADMSALTGSGISVTVTGKELDELKRIAKDFAADLENVEGLENISDGIGEASPEFRIVVDKGKASAHNLTVAQVYADVYAKMSTSTTSTTLSTVSKDYPVIIIDGEAEEYTTDSIRDMVMTVTGRDGTTEDIKLSDVADFEMTDGFASINRVNQLRTITVSAAVDDSHNVGLVGNEVQRLIDRTQVPDGYKLTLTGENETINDALTELLKMLALAVVFVYLVMVAQFQSMLMPFIIMFTIPLAFTGGFLGLIICGMDISVISMLGFVILTGVIVNNGIVLVDYINQLRRGGMEKKAAIAEAGRTRLRPILMTALTTILGLITLAAGMGMGADLIQPMAVVTIGGLAYGTLMTLWIVPCIYDIMSRKEDMTEEEF